MRSRTHRQHGFTLVEIAIVLVIIGFLLAGILNAQSVIRNARIKDTIKAVNDMAYAAQQFKDRYGDWPGTLQTAVASIPNLTVTCVGNNTGIITTAAQSACASEELIRSTMLRGTAGVPIKVSGAVTLSVTGAAISGVPTPANWRNVVLVQNIDCDIAVQIDHLSDDGSTNTGNFITAANLCGPTGRDQVENTLVPLAVLRLN